MVQSYNEFPCKYEVKGTHWQNPRIYLKDALSESVTISVMKIGKDGETVGYPMNANVAGFACTTFNRIVLCPREVST